MNPLRGLAACRALPLAVALSLLAPPAGAASKAECLSAYDKGQELRDANRLREAREAFVICSQPSCPAAVVSECVPWLRDLDAALPTLVVAVRRHDGVDVAEARLLIDGRPVAERIDGTPLALDPGVHQVRVESAAGSVEQSVVVRHAEKNRLVTLTLPAPSGASSAPSASAAPAASTSAPAPSAGPPLGSWIAAGAGALSLGAFAFFGLRARSDVDRLKGSCSPRCSDAEVDPARTKALVADVALGASVVAFGLAAYLWISHKPQPSSSAQLAPLVGKGSGGLGLTLSF